MAKMDEREVEVQTPYFDYSMPLPPVDRGVSLSGPVQTGLNDMGIMELLASYLGGKAVEETAKKTGVDDWLGKRMQGALQSAQEVGGDVLNAIIPQAQASNVDAQPTNADFAPNPPLVVSQDVGNVNVNNAVPESPLNPSYNQPGTPTDPIAAFLQNPETPPPSDEETATVLSGAANRSASLLNQGQTPDPDTSALGSIWNNVFKGGMLEGTLGNEEWRLRKAMILNSMRLNPDAALTTAFASRIKDLRSQKGASRLADQLEAKDPVKYASIITGLRSGDLDTKDVMSLIMKAPSSLEQKMELFRDDPTLARQMAEAGLFGAEPTLNKEWNKQQMEVASKEVQAYGAAGNTASNLLRSLENFGRLLSQVEETGPNAELALKVREAAAAWGLPVDMNSLSDLQALRAQSANMVAEQLRLNKGPQTDFDAMFTASFIPSIGLTKEANEQIKDYMTSVNKLTTIWANEADSARLLPPEKINEKLVEINKLQRNTPGVIQTADGWKTFSGFLTEARKQPSLKNKSEMELVNLWNQLYQKYR